MNACAPTNKNAQGLLYYPVESENYNCNPSQKTINLTSKASSKFSVVGNEPEIILTLIRQI